MEELQERANFTKQDTALDLGVTVRTVERWLAGESKPPKAAIMALKAYINTGIKII